MSDPAPVGGPAPVSGTVLVFGTALAEAFVALVVGEEVAAEVSIPGGRGMVDQLPTAVSSVMAGRALDAVAALVGPGSFTGIRAGLAMAHGIGLACDCAVVGVTVGEAVRAGLGIDGPLWTATDARRGTLFLEGDGETRSVRLEAIGRPSGNPVLAGDMADGLAVRLRELGVAVTVAERALPGALGVARAARGRMAGELPPLAPLPLYVDAPQTSAPGTAARPPPGTAAWPPPS